VAFEALFFATPAKHILAYKPPQWDGDMHFLDFLETFVTPGDLREQLAAIRTLCRSFPCPVSAYLNASL
jgi:hypothetical protein